MTNTWRTWVDKVELVRLGRGKSQLDMLGTVVASHHNLHPSQIEIISWYEQTDSFSYLVYYRIIGGGKQ